MDVAAKQAELDSLTWYHEFDFGNGLRTRNHGDNLDGHRRIWRFIESHLSGIDFRGKSVLDIGAWDGYWSFFAESRGARSVLASDDLGQNWSAGRGIHLAKELLGSSIEINQSLSVYDLASLGRKFDVILFLGVYYHLHDPFYALAQIRHCCHPGTVVVIDGPVATALGANESLHDYANHFCEWLPTEEALRQLLGAAYFTSAAAGYLDPPPPDAPPAPPPPPGRLGWRWRLGMCREALRGSRPEMARRIAGVVPKPAPASPRENKRIVLTCAPHEGQVDMHYYRPPFGLHAHDPRFRDARGTPAPKSPAKTRSHLARGTAHAYDGVTFGRLPNELPR
jgi:tRNA (mo5U34)-methyltransferase